MTIATQQEREATAHDHCTGTPPGNLQKPGFAPAQSARQSIKNEVAS
jgi:hypothetical protein